MKCRSAALVGCMALLVASACRADVKPFAGFSVTPSSAYSWRGIMWTTAGIAEDGYVGAKISDWLSVQGYIWHWDTFETTAKGGTNETDYDLSATVAPPQWPCNFTAGWAYYGGQIGNNARELYAKFTADKIFLRPGVDVYWDYLAPTYYVNLRLGHTFSKLPIKRLTVDTRANYGHLLGPGINSMAEFKVSGSAIYDLGRGWTVAPTLDVVTVGNAFPGLETQDVHPVGSLTVAYNRDF